MDKFKEDEKQERFNRKKKMIEQVANDFPTLQFKEYFPTSIWDETLYQAWSQIVQQLIPKMPFIQDTLRQICEVSGCDEIVLFERSTFLIITCFNKAGRKDILRYERVSNIVKQFKLSCNKMGASIDSVFVKSDKMTTLIREFTDNTSIMVIYSNPEIQESLINLNIAYAGKHFEKHIKQ
jgi:Ras-related GTP-binding protein A/B